MARRHSFLFDLFAGSADGGAGFVEKPESGSIFVQIGDENVHRVRAVMDEVFGEENFVALIAYAKTNRFFWDSAIISV